jgi:DNA-binding LytR/AlgR family response regulator
MKLRIAIVDDDAQMRTRLRDCLNDLLGNSAGIAVFPSGEDFLAGWEAGRFDVILLDIFMESLTGMDVARKIRETDGQVKLVFCTTSNEFASESYEVNACYYLRKPFGRERLKAMLDRLDLAEMEKLRTVRLPDGTSVALRDVIYADAAAHRVTLHCKRGGDVTVRASFSEIEALLCAYPYFFCPSKGLLINFYEVTAQNMDTFTMSDGTRVPISRRKAKEVSEAYSSFRFDLLRKDGER